MSGSRAWFDKDFYSVLGVKEDAPAEEIKRAYKKLARQYHPDRNPGDRAAEDKMKDASEAYDVLSDAAKRQEYDQMRQLSRSGYAGGMPGTGWQSNVRYEDIPFDIGDLFGGIFGGGNGRGRSRGARVEYAQEPEPSYDVRAVARISYPDAVLGATIRVKTADRSVKLKVPPGTQPGTVMRARGKGAPMPGGGQGDMLVTIQVDVPKSPSPEERKLIEELAALKRKRADAPVGG